MKEIGRKNVTQEKLDTLFDTSHTGISVKDTIGQTIVVTGFVVYDMEDGSYHLKFFDNNDKDYYTSSQVFIKEFMRLAKEKDDEETFTIEPKAGKSRKGRSYLYLNNDSEDRTTNDNWKSINW